MGSCKPCPCCAEDGGSDVCHFAVCHAIVGAIKQVLPHVQTGWTEHPDLEGFLGIGFQENHFNIQVMLVDAVHSAFTDTKHGSCSNAALLIQGRIRQATRRWQGYQSLLHSELD